MDDDNSKIRSDIKTPPQPIRRRHGHLQPAAVVFYRECLRNHAAGLGGLALDGCGEFLCSDPSSLKCVACGCHRNFHRRWLQDPKYMIGSGDEKGSNTKRHRSKFSERQKEQMRGFAEKMGWRMRKGDERAVEEFCNEVGVSRGVLKVWIHNNKLTMSIKNKDHHHHHHHYHKNSNGSSSSS